MTTPLDVAVKKPVRTVIASGTNPVAAKAAALEVGGKMSAAVEQWLLRRATLRARAPFHHFSTAEAASSAHR
ncbi:hypothetical protein [Streptosporangium sp. CA-115845]|uniref:hypothetical protein n=1 Tax=Streptosporangium sp. CA-115845 TaxID=3240071 RepID=UPI003D8AF517